MPGSIGWQGLVVILLVALIIFGPKRLPEMGRSLGRGMREFKDSVTGRDDDFDRDELPRGESDPVVSATARERDPA
ncbi:MAG: twin-arginine translocase TatA/TatE family subunit [Gaiellaceae bacterium]